MKLVPGGLRRRQFEAFIADATDALFRAGHLMTGDAGAAEDLFRRRSSGLPGGGTECG